MAAEPARRHAGVIGQRLLLYPAAASLAWVALTVPAAPASGVPQPTGDATATVETSPVLSTGDAADDPAIWAHPTDPSRSVVVGNDKGGALEVYDLSGARIQRIAEGFFGNVDVRKAFPTATGPVDLVGVYRLGLRFYQIDPATRTLANITDHPSGSIPAPFAGDGFCLYHSPTTGRFHAFVNDQNGQVAQFELGDTDGDGLVDGRQVRAWDVGGEVEGCVADDGLGYLYISEEDTGIWKYGAEPTAQTDPASRVLVDATIPMGGRLAPDVEGLTIVYQPNGTGYLMASAQAGSNTNNFYAVYERQGSNGFVRTFKVVTGLLTDGCGWTDGIDAVATNLGPEFPNGMFVCQDNQNLAPGAQGNQNFKFVPLERVVGLEPPPSNVPPVAVFSSSCAGLVCGFDGSGSSDPDGSIVSYGWDFGDGGSGSGVQPSHSYGTAGGYQVTLTITDSGGATDVVTHTVTVDDTSAAIAFRGAARFVGNTISATLSVPPAVQASDGLILFATINNTTATVSGPSGVTGWTPVADFVTGSARTMVWRKVAAPGDGGKVLSLGLSAYTKISLQLVGYAGTSTANPIATLATRSDPVAVTTHPTPTVSVTGAGSWLLSYWADKSATTTDWGPPPSVLVRDEAIGTGSGRITSLVADSGAVIPTGTAGGLNATTDTASRAATVSIALAPAQPPPSNVPPVAVFSSSCAGLVCGFDGSGSSDPDGSIVSYGWDFGDGGSGSGVQPSHSYGTAGGYQVTLTITDSGGATDVVTHTVTVDDTSAAIAFRGAARFVGNTISATLSVPPAVQASDGLILFATMNNTTATVSGPSGVTGWTPVADFVTGSARTMVWRKVAAPGDGGKVLSLGLSAYTKISLQLVGYAGTSTANPIATLATRSDPVAVTTHPTPTVSVTGAGSWLLSYWADKSATTTDWGPPPSVLVRDEAIGTGSGRITSLVADSGAVIPTGTAGGLNATTDTASRAATVSIALAPAP